MRYFLLIGMLLGSLFCFAQEFELTVRANQVAAQRKVYLEWINARGVAVKVDSLLPDANHQVVFKGKVLDQGGFYLVNFFDVPNPQKVLVILEGGEKVFVQADGRNTPEKAGTFQIKSDAPNLSLIHI